MKDAPDYCRWLADREVTKFLSIYENKPPTRREERAWIKEAKKDKTRICLAINTTEGKHIGSVSLMKIDYFSKRAEYGIFIGDRRYHGQGYGTEAGKLLVDYGFKRLKLYRICLRLIGYNVRGQRSYEKIGFKIEGRLRDHVYRDGCYHDEILMGILRNEYLKNDRKKYGFKIRKN